ncbi:ADP-heptose:LPS heptosyltransferase [Amycolatopsis bartoniae]|uniref:Glycosyl transferase n=1 Tax=Amycolatopsis bartoniae TaxID=941986 RepID=A0A8H9J2M5_9PSEU|nr:glycosyltransferase family 9 protein [Amycolatopsis bartoniae]MBB2939001.1 ADP-heptose:LPS heptosyltransferase [Amycolatopsis bartoniae]TVT04256.1 glycosyltransferase family 9 protein [Amycolatopsis bartoniae]GHF65664.1 glycosyl transferase [Amycolatopsis bartoniae]
MNSVVALRPLKLGDFLVVVPALRALRRAWPEHELVFATNEWLRPVVELAGCVDTLLPTHGMRPLDPRFARPDVAVNLHGTGPRSNAVLDALRPGRRIGHSGHGWPGPEWVDDIHERDRWCRLLRAHGIDADPGDFLLRPPPVPSPAPDAVIVHPGAAYGSKRWPLDRFAEVVRQLRAEGCPVVLTGSAAERDLCLELAARTHLPPETVLAGSTGLSTLAALVAGARLVISGDTGIAHLAYAYRTPTVTLFGPASAFHWGPPEGPHRALSADAARRGDPFAEDPDPALLGVSSAEVIAASMALLGSPAGA